MVATSVVCEGSDDPGGTPSGPCPDPARRPSLAVFDRMVKRRASPAATVSFAHDVTSG